MGKAILYKNFTMKKKKNLKSSNEKEILCLVLPAASTCTWDPVLLLKRVSPHPSLQLSASNAF